MRTIDQRAEEPEHREKPDRAATGPTGGPGAPIDRAGLAMRSPSDTRLMRLIQRGDLRAFESFYDRHVAVALRMAMRVLGDRDLAEDAVQDAFIGFWRSRASYEASTAAAGTWLLVIVSNRAIDLRRRECRRRGMLSGDTVPVHRPASDCTEAEGIARADHQRLRAQLQRLPSEQRQVIELAYFDGLTHEQIARRLELPLGTAKGRLRLGLEKLRRVTADNTRPLVDRTQHR